MNLFTADVGQGKVHVYDSGNDKFHGKLPQENLINLNISGLEKGDTLVVECAHLRESHRLTLAQPFNFDQLEELKENADRKGITILLFPQKSTPKARKLAGVEADAKTDEADTRAIASFLLEDEKAFNSLKEFIPTKLKTFQEENSSIFDYIQQSNEDINIAKTCEYGFSKKIDYEDEVSKWIKKYALRLTEYLGGDMELIHAIGLKFDKKGNIKIDVPNRIYTLVHSILRPNGDLRVRPDLGLVPNWKYVKAHYLGCKPYHMNQGVAASNYKHWMRRAVSEYAYPDKKSANTSDFQVGMLYEEYSQLKKARTKVDKMTQKIWYALRKMIVEDNLRVENGLR
tara:strand:- start:1923 stop:2948 length:1026 start_codon:yes stop_codon:yes gene_type:complete